MNILAKKKGWNQAQHCLIGLELPTNVFLSGRQVISV